MATNGRMILFYKCKHFPQIARIFTDDTVDFWGFMATNARMMVNDAVEINYLVKINLRHLQNLREKKIILLYHRVSIWIM